MYEKRFSDPSPPRGASPAESRRVSSEPGLAYGMNPTVAGQLRVMRALAAGPIVRSRSATGLAVGSPRRVPTLKLGDQILRNQPGVELEVCAAIFGARRRRPAEVSPAFLVYVELPRVLQRLPGEPAPESSCQIGRERFEQFGPVLGSLLSSLLEFDDAAAYLPIGG